MANISVTFPDGSIRTYDNALTAADVAADIGAGLAKAALAARIDGELVDLSTLIDRDVTLAIVTNKDEEALDLIRHTAAHVMAQAVKELYPDTQVTIGPVIKDGFYYDFAREESFNPDDLEKIEKRMQEIVDRDTAITRKVLPRDEAVKTFLELGEDYKKEIIDDLPEGEDVSVYGQGDWMDLCRGPHLPSTGKLGKAFKLLKVSGAYWRGDAANAMLQRIYGTAWLDKKELKAYLTMLEEAEKRDHRRLGREMDLFHFQEEAPGAIFWHPKGWRLFRSLIDYMRARQDAAGYDEISTPTLMDRCLWEQSGHWEKFGEDMYTSQTTDERVFALKPMNCPGGIQIFRQQTVSYKDLPWRISEFGKVHRYEASGTLHGLMRVREFTQDDAHIYCTPEQMESECNKVVDLIMDIYKTFGFEDIRIKFADRPEKRIGSDELWDKVEGALKAALNNMGLEYTLNPGEGTFYGPKIEFVLRDAIGRDWQCGTLQVDMNLPQRFDITYVDNDGEKKQPVMLHRALFGSIERFCGILIEHYAGRFPLWLSPMKVAVCTITGEADQYATEVYEMLRKAGIISELDLRNEKINYKIREHSAAKVPVILVIGKNEVEERKVAMRRLGGKAQEFMGVDEAVAALKEENTPPVGK